MHQKSNQHSSSSVDSGQNNLSDTWKMSISDDRNSEKILDRYKLLQINDKKKRDLISIKSSGIGFGEIKGDEVSTFLPMVDIFAKATHPIDVVGKVKFKEKINRPERKLLEDFVFDEENNKYEDTMTKSLRKFEMLSLTTEQEEWVDSDIFNSLLHLSSTHSNSSFFLEKMHDGNQNMALAHLHHTIKQANKHGNKLFEDDEKIFSSLTSILSESDISRYDKAVEESRKQLQTHKTKDKILSPEEKNKKVRFSSVVKIEEEGTDNKIDIVECQASYVDDSLCTDLFIDPICDNATQSGVYVDNAAYYINTLNNEFVDLLSGNTYLLDSPDYYLNNDYSYYLESCEFISLDLDFEVNISNRTSDTYKSDFHLTVANFISHKSCYNLDKYFTLCYVNECCMGPCSASFPCNLCSKCSCLFSYYLLPHIFLASVREFPSCSNIIFSDIEHNEGSRFRQPQETSLCFSDNTLVKVDQIKKMMFLGLFCTAYTSDVCRFSDFSINKIETSIFVDSCLKPERKDKNRARQRAFSLFSSEFHDFINRNDPLNIMNGKNVKSRRDSLAINHLKKLKLLEYLLTTSLDTICHEALYSSENNSISKIEKFVYSNDIEFRNNTINTYHTSVIPVNFDSICYGIDELTLLMNINHSFLHNYEHGLCNRLYNLTYVCDKTNFRDINFIRSVERLHEDIEYFVNDENSNVFCSEDDDSLNEYRDNITLSNDAFMQSECNSIYNYGNEYIVNAKLYRNLRNRPVSPSPTLISYFSKSGKYNSLINDVLHILFRQRKKKRIFKYNLAMNRCYKYNIHSPKYRISNNTMFSSTHCCISELYQDNCQSLGIEEILLGFFPVSNVYTYDDITIEHVESVIAEVEILREIDSNTDNSLINDYNFDSSFSDTSVTQPSLNHTRVSSILPVQKSKLLSDFILHPLKFYSFSASYSSKMDNIVNILTKSLEIDSSLKRFNIFRDFFLLNTSTFSSTLFEVENLKKIGNQFFDDNEICTISHEEYSKRLDTRGLSPRHRMRSMKHFEELKKQHETLLYLLSVSFKNHNSLKSSSLFSISHMHNIQNSQRKLDILSTILKENSTNINIPYEIIDAILSNKEIAEAQLAEIQELFEINHPELINIYNLENASILSLGYLSNIQYFSYSTKFLSNNMSINAIYRMIVRDIDTRFYELYDAKHGNISESSDISTPCNILEVARSLNDSFIYEEITKFVCDNREAFLHFPAFRAKSTGYNSLVKYFIPFGSDVFEYYDLLKLDEFQFTQEIQTLSGPIKESMLKLYKNIRMQNSLTSEIIFKTISMSCFNSNSYTVYNLMDICKIGEIYSKMDFSSKLKESQILKSAGDLYKRRMMGDITIDESKYFENSTIEYDILNSVYYTSNTSVKSSDTFSLNKLHKVYSDHHSASTKESSQTGAELFDDISSKRNDFDVTELSFSGKKVDKYNFLLEPNYFKCQRSLFFSDKYAIQELFEMERIISTLDLLKKHGLIRGEADIILNLNKSSSLIQNSVVTNSSLNNILKNSDIFPPDLQKFLRYNNENYISTLHKINFNLKSSSYLTDSYVVPSSCSLFDEMLNDDMCSAFLNENFSFHEILSNIINNIGQRNEQYSDDNIEFYILQACSGCTNINMVKLRDFLKTFLRKYRARAFDIIINKYCCNNTRYSSLGYTVENLHNAEPNDKKYKEIYSRLRNSKSGLRALKKSSTKRIRKVLSNMKYSEDDINFFVDVFSNRVCLQIYSIFDPIRFVTNTCNYNCTKCSILELYKYSFGVDFDENLVHEILPLGKSGRISYLKRMSYSKSQISTILIQIKKYKECVSLMTPLILKETIFYCSKPSYTCEDGSVRKILQSFEDILDSIDYGEHCKFFDTNDNDSAGEMQLVLVSESDNVRSSKYSKLSKDRLFQIKSRCFKKYDILEQPSFKLTNTIYNSHNYTITSIVDLLKKFLIDELVGILGVSELASSEDIAQVSGFVKLSPYQEKLLCIINSNKLSLEDALTDTKYLCILTCYNSNSYSVKSLQSIDPLYEKLDLLHFEDTNDEQLINAIQKLGTNGHDIQILIQKFKHYKNTSVCDDSFLSSVSFVCYTSEYNNREIDTIANVLESMIYQGDCDIYSLPYTEFILTLQSIAHLDFEKYSRLYNGYMARRYRDIFNVQFMLKMPRYDSKYRNNDELSNMLDESIGYVDDSYDLDGILFDVRTRRLLSKLSHNESSFIKEVLKINDIPPKIQRMLDEALIYTMNNGFLSNPVLFRCHASVKKDSFSVRMIENHVDNVIQRSCSRDKLGKIVTMSEYEFNNYLELQDNHNDRDELIRIYNQTKSERLYEGHRNFACQNILFSSSKNDIVDLESKLKYSVLSDKSNIAKKVHFVCDRTTYSTCLNSVDYIEDILHHTKCTLSDSIGVCSTSKNESFNERLEYTLCKRDDGVSRYFGEFIFGNQTFESSCNLPMHIFIKTIVFLCPHQSFLSDTLTTVPIDIRKYHTRVMNKSEIWLVETISKMSNVYERFLLRQAYHDCNYTFLETVNFASNGSTFNCTVKSVDNILSIINLSRLYMATCNYSDIASTMGKISRNDENVLNISPIKKNMDQDEVVFSDDEEILGLLQFYTEDKNAHVIHGDILSRLIFLNPSTCFNSISFSADIIEERVAGIGSGVSSYCNLTGLVLNESEDILPNEQNFPYSSTIRKSILNSRSKYTLALYIYGIHFKSHGSPYLSSNNFVDDIQGGINEHFLFDQSFETAICELQNFTYMHDSYGDTSRMEYVINFFRTHVNILPREFVSMYRYIFNHYFLFDPIQEVCFVSKSSTYNSFTFNVHALVDNYYRQFVNYIGIEGVFDYSPEKFYKYLRDHEFKKSQAEALINKYSIIHENNICYDNILAYLRSFECQIVCYNSFNDSVKCIENATFLCNEAEDCMTARLSDSSVVCFINKCISDCILCNEYKLYHHVFDSGMYNVEYLEMKLSHYIESDFSRENHVFSNGNFKCMYDERMFSSRLNLYNSNLYDLNNIEDIMSYRKSVDDYFLNLINHSDEEILYGIQNNDVDAKGPSCREVINMIDDARKSINRLCLYGNSFLHNIRYIEMSTPFTCDRFDIHNICDIIAFKLTLNNISSDLSDPTRCELSSFLKYKDISINGDRIIQNFHDIIYVKYITRSCPYLSPMRDLFLESYDIVSTLPSDDSLYVFIDLLISEPLCIRRRRRKRKSPTSSLIKSEHSQSLDKSLLNTYSSTTTEDGDLSRSKVGRTKSLLNPSSLDSSMSRMSPISISSSRKGTIFETPKVSRQMGPMFRGNMIASPDILGTKIKYSDAGKLNRIFEIFERPWDKINTVAAFEDDEFFLSSVVKFGLDDKPILQSQLNHLNSSIRGHSYHELSIQNKRKISEAAIDWRIFLQPSAFPIHLDMTEVKRFLNIIQREGVESQTNDAMLADSQNFVSFDLTPLTSKKLQCTELISYNFTPKNGRLSDSIYIFISVSGDIVTPLSRYRLTDKKVSLKSSLKIGSESYPFINSAQRKEWDEVMRKVIAKDKKIMIEGLIKSLGEKVASPDLTLSFIMLTSPTLPVSIAEDIYNCFSSEGMTDYLIRGYILYDLTTREPSDIFINEINPIVKLFASQAKEWFKDYLSPRLSSVVTASQFSTLLETNLVFIRSNAAHILRALVVLSLLVLCDKDITLQLFYSFMISSLDYLCIDIDEIVRFPSRNDLHILTSIITRLVEAEFDIKMCDKSLLHETNNRLIKYIIDNYDVFYEKLTQFIDMPKSKHILVCSFYQNFRFIVNSKFGLKIPNRVWKF